MLLEVVFLVIIEPLEHIRIYQLFLLLHHFRKLLIRLNRGLIEPLTKQNQHKRRSYKQLRDGLVQRFLLWGVLLLLRVKLLLPEVVIRLLSQLLLLCLYFLFLVRGHVSVVLLSGGIVAELLLVQFLKVVVGGCYFDEMLLGFFVGLVFHGVRVVLLGELSVFCLYLLLGSGNSQV